MGLGIEAEAVLAYVFGLILLYLAGWLLLAPFKVVLKLILNALIGGVILVLINLFGGSWGIYVGINPVTALITGFFGIPGAILLLFLQIILV